MDNRLSLFTPTHNPKYLLDAYGSIREQSFYEWVICPNGSCKVEDIPEEIRKDERVQITEVPKFWIEAHSKDGHPNIGALKKFACDQCTGDVLVELDHDDMIPGETLYVIAEAFNDSDVVAVHTNFAEFNESDWTARSYSEYYGWKYRPYIDAQGHALLEAIAPEATPHHCASMFFCPNHTRAWRASTYKRIGGHDPTLAVADDMDLICRLFLEGEIGHLDICGALYRVNGKNTFMARNDEIWRLVPILRDKYLALMAEAECKRNGWRMIDLGGRFGCPPGYESVDINPGGDICADLTKRYPFEDSSIGIVRAGDFLEHIADKMHSLSEIYRVLRPGGYLFSKTPSTCGPDGEAGMGADQDPTHVSRWNRNSFWYVTKAETAKYIDNTTVRFFPVINENYYPDDWCRENHIPYVRFVGIAMKEGYRPHGPVEI